MTELSTVPSQPSVRADRKIVHVTDRDTFRRCRRLWKYKEESLVLKGQAPGPTHFGTAMHTVLAGVYLELQENHPVDWLDYPEEFDILLEQALEWWGGACELALLPPDMHSLGIEMLKGYFQKYISKDFSQWGILAVEKEVHYDIPGTNLTLVGTMDLIVQDLDTNGVWIADHKNYKEFATADSLLWDDQMTAYVFLAKEAGYNVKGAIYNMLRKAVPKQPKINLDLSVSLQVTDTTYELYKAALGNSPKPATEKHQDILESLKGDRFFRREQVIRTRAKLRDFQRNLVGEMSEMADPNLPIYPNFTRDCSYCEMASLCRIESEGGDVEQAKFDLYEVKPHRQ